VFQGELLRIHIVEEAVEFLYAMLSTDEYVIYVSAIKGWFKVVPVQCLAL
jgi:hypothetical protein